MKILRLKRDFQGVPCPRTQRGGWQLRRDRRAAREWPLGAPRGSWRPARAPAAGTTMAAQASPRQRRKPARPLSGCQVMVASACARRSARRTHRTAASGASRVPRSSQRGDRFQGLERFRVPRRRAHGVQALPRERQGLGRPPLPLLQGGQFLADRRPLLPVPGGAHVPRHEGLITSDGAIHLPQGHQSPGAQARQFPRGLRKVGLEFVEPPQQFLGRRPGRRWRGPRAPPGVPGARRTAPAPPAGGRRRTESAAGSRPGSPCHPTRPASGGATSIRGQAVPRGGPILGEEPGDCQGASRCPGPGGADAASAIAAVCRRAGDGSRDTGGL